MTEELEDYTQDKEYMEFADEAVALTEAIHSLLGEHSPKMSAIHFVAATLTAFTEALVVCIVASNINDEGAITLLEKIKNDVFEALPEARQAPQAELKEFANG